MPPTDLDFIDPERLEELRQLPPVEWDLARLIRLCEELNAASHSGSYHAVAALTRSLLDHVPPIFGCATFTQVTNNYAGSKSFRETMKYLDSAARKIADAHLHTQVRAQEILPNATQVNFAPAVDVLLAEIVRINRQAAIRLQTLQAKVARASELMTDFLCPDCDAPIERREPGYGTVTSDWGEYEVDWEDVIYECGRVTHDGQVLVACGSNKA